MKITTITPCYNAESYIEETILSVIEQTAVIEGTVELEYILIDGNSSDNTIAIIKKNIEKYKNIKNLKMKFISEPDLGMYDALQKGLKISTGDIHSYLNAGDLYNKTCYETVIDIFTSFKEIKWICGIHGHYNEKSQLTHANMPYIYDMSLIKKGVYGAKKIIKLPYIQQETTFWRSSLTQEIDLLRLKEFRYAGDYYLWYTFSNHADIFTVETFLGGFKIHEGQLSEAIQDYQNEVYQISDKLNIFDVIKIIINSVGWSVSNRIKKKLGGKKIISYNHKNKTWEAN